MIEGFATGAVTLGAARIAYEVGGAGPPLLLLHGFPQNRALWARVGPALARDYTVVCADLRGYGDSTTPGGVAAASFREMARDMGALMDHLGFARFHLAGHDRGARVAHRLALDAPERLLSLTLMDIIPTHLLLDQLEQRVAKAYYHWFFLAQPAPFPETLIAADPDYYFESCLTGWGATRLADFAPDQLAAYRESWRRPAVIAAMCDDYRAALEVDFADDTADLHRRIPCPTLVLWGGDGAMGRAFDVAATWAERCADLRGQALPGGHFFIDTHPGETVAALRAFLAGANSAPPRA